MELTNEINHWYAPYDGRDNNVTNNARDEHWYQTHCRADRRVADVILIIQLVQRSVKKFKSHEEG
jgi:hypothetical protein